MGVNAFHQENPHDFCFLGTLAYKAHVICICNYQ